MILVVLLGYTIGFAFPGSTFVIKISVSFCLFYCAHLVDQVCLLGGNSCSKSSTTGSGAGKNY